MLYSDPFESTEISAERPLDRCTVARAPRIGAESSFTPTPYPRRWKGAFIVAARRVYSIFSSRTRRVHPRFLSTGLGFFNPFTSWPPYPKRAWVSSWLEFFIRILDNARLLVCIGMKCNFHPAKIRENLLSRFKLFKLYLHSFQFDAAHFFRFYFSLSLSLSFRAKEIIPLLSVCTGVSSFPRNDIITRWLAGSFEPTPRSWVN